MNDHCPDLRTLFHWAARADAGDPPRALRDWLAMARADQGGEALACWTRIVEARRQLANGDVPMDEPTLSAELVARYVDGQTDPGESRQVEDACWQSSADLCEVLSGLTFCQPPLPAGRNGKASQAPAPALTQRLKALVGEAPPAESSVASPAAPPSPMKGRRPFGSSRYGRSRGRRPGAPWHAPVLAAVALAIVLIGLLGMVEFFTRTPEEPGVIASPGESTGGAPGESRGPVSPRRDSSDSPGLDRAQPSTPQVAEAGPGDDGRPSNVKPDSNDASPTRPEPLPPTPRDGPASRDSSRVVSDDRPKNRAEMDPTPPIGPPAPPSSDSPPTRQPIRADELANLDLTTDSAIGAVLSQPDGGGPWRVAAGRQSVAGAMRLVSLAESWSTVEFPGLGALILAGDAEVEVRHGGDRVLEVALRRGRVGWQDLPADRQVRLVTDDGRWTVSGRDDYSTVGVLRGVESAEVFVAAGIVAVDSIPIAKDQYAPLGDAITPASLASRAPLPFALAEATRGVGEWLQAPSERQRREWQAANGKLVEQLAAADDAAVELARLRAAARPGRQAGLLARWELALSASAGQDVWKMLSDRDDAVRDAGMAYLYEIPFRDRRARQLFAEFSEQVDGALARHMVEWLMGLQRGQTMFAPRAVELIDALGHEELAVRQVAISVLERHTRPQFEAARRKPPAYEPDAPASKRAAAQTQWRLLIRQLLPSK